MIPTTPDFGWLFIKMVLGLIFVLALALFLIRFVLPRTAIGRLRGWGNRAGMPGWVSVIDRFILEPRKSLYLVKVAGRYFILGSAENSMNLLAELSRSEGEKIEGSNP